MSGSTSRRKGARGELELAALLGAEKVSSMYRLGPDLIFRGYPVEVKRRNTNSGFGLIDRLLRDTPIVGVRADRGEWILSMRPETLLDLIDLFTAGQVAVLAELVDEELDRTTSVDDPDTAYAGLLTALNVTLDQIKEDGR